jgi:ABC-type antimicrobial peptide transport system permease subunit
MVGMSRKGVISLMLIQSLTYAIPAWIVGLILSQVLCTTLGVELIQKASNIRISGLLSSSAIGVSTLLGTFVPIVSSILPIRKALGYHKNWEELFIFINSL